jgi:hypothetical protein
MELNGALSNPFVTEKDLLSRLSKLREVLVSKAAEAPRRPRAAPLMRTPVLETVTCVLELAGRPMRAREVHAAASALYGSELRWPSVREALSAYSRGRDRRFVRIQYGLYQLRR